MILKRLVLENVRAHESGTFELSGGMTALTGRNGVGKSTLLEALFFALTGKCATEGRTRPGLLRWGAKKGLVRLDFSAGGVGFTLYRGIPDSKDRLSWEEGGKKESVSRMGDVSARMSELMGGVDAEVLLLSSFMPQGGAMRMVFGTQAERQREYASLFRLAHLEKARRDLQSSLNEIERVPDYAGDLAAASARLSSLSSECSAASAALASARAGFKSGEARRNALRAREGRRTRADVENAKKAVSGQIEGLSAKLDSLEKASAALPRPVPADPARAARASAYAEAGRVVAELSAVRDRMAALKSGRPQSRPADPDGREAAGLRGEAGALRSRLADLEKWLRLGRCPTCGTEVPSSPDDISKARRALGDAEARLSEVEAADSAARAAVAGWNEAERVLSELSASEARLSSRLMDLSTMVENFDPDEHAAWEASAKAAAEAGAERSRLDRDASLVRRDLSEAGARLAALDGADFVEPLSNEDEIFIRDYDGLAASLQELAAAEARLLSERGALEKSARDKAAWSAYGSLCEGHRARLAKVREALHVDNLPKALMQGYRETLSASVNKYLAKFNQTFLVSVGPDLEARCDFSEGGSGLAGDALSGGQRVLLTVCFRLAVTELLAGWVSLLVFDEPTPHLDADNRAALGEAFKLVKAYLKTQGIQTIVATHEPELLAVADAEIRL